MICSWLRSIIINSKDSKWRWKNKINCYKVFCLMVPTFTRILDNWYDRCDQECCHHHLLSFPSLVFLFWSVSFVPKYYTITRCTDHSPPQAVLKSSRASLQTMISCICRIFDAWSKSLIDYNSDWQERKLGNNCFTKAYSTIGQREQGGEIKRIKQWRNEGVMWNRKIRETRKAYRCRAPFIEQDGERNEIKWEKTVRET